MLVILPVYSPQDASQSATRRADSMVAAYAEWQKRGGVGAPDYFRDIAPLLR